MSSQTKTSSLHAPSFVCQRRGCAILVKSHLPSACATVALFPVYFNTIFVAVSPCQEIGTSLSGGQCLATGAKLCPIVQGRGLPKNAAQSHTARRGRGPTLQEGHGKVTGLWVHPGTNPQAARGRCEFKALSAPSLDTRLPVSRE